MKKHRRLLTLAKRLTQFGLNPGDWKIERRSRNHYRIYQPANDDFEFVGKIDRRWRWVDLELKVLFVAC